MTSRFAKIGVFTYLFALATFSSVHVAWAQTPESPPIKWGLWKTEWYSTTTEMEYSPRGHAELQPHTSITEVRGCLTLDTWKESFQKMLSPMQDSCKVSKWQQDAHSLIFDETCTGEHSPSNVHFEGLFDNDEHIHGTVVMTMQVRPMPGLPDGNATIGMRMKSHYVSAFCGVFKPGQGKVMHAQ